MYTDHADAYTDLLTAVANVIEPVQRDGYYPEITPHGEGFLVEWQEGQVRRFVLLGIIECASPECP